MMFFTQRIFANFLLYSHQCYLSVISFFRHPAKNFCVVTKIILFIRLLMVFSVFHISDKNLGFLSTSYVQNRSQGNSGIVVKSKLPRMLFTIAYSVNPIQINHQIQIRLLVKSKPATLLHQYPVLLLKYFDCYISSMVRYWKVRRNL